MADKLAIFGGTPVRSQQFTPRKTMGDSEKQAVAKVMDSDCLSGFFGAACDQFLGGEKVREFEATWAKQFNYKHAISVNSWTKLELPDLILLDIRMPGGGGISAFKTLKEIEKTKSIPVIFITAFPTNDVKKLVMKMGANGLIAKPFDTQLLTDSINKILFPNPKIFKN